MTSRRFVLAVSALALLSFSVMADQELKFADVLTDNVVLQRGKDVRCWGTAKPGSKVEVLLTQSRDEVVKFAGEQALAQEVAEKKPQKEVPGIGKVKLAYVDEAAVPLKSVTKTTTVDKDGRWELTLGEHAASFTPTYLAAKSGDESAAIQNLLIGEVWIASGQSNMEWGATRDKMWENKGLIFNGIRYAKVRGASTAPRESFAEGVTKGPAFEPWIVCEDGAVDHVSTVAYLFAQYLHRRLKVPVGIINIAQGGSFAREWCSLEILEKMDSPTVNAHLAEFSDRQKTAEAVGWRSGPAELYNGRLYPIRKMTVAGVIYMQGENESLGGAVPQYWKTFPGVIQSYREALASPDLPFGIITMQGYGGYAAVREIHLQTHRRTPDTGYIVAHDIGGNIHPSWKRPLAERAVYWALRDVYHVITSGKRLRVKETTFADGKARMVFEQVTLKDGEWGDGEVTMPWTNDQQPPEGFDIAGVDKAWYRARVRRGLSAEEGIVLSHPLVPEPVAVRYAWGGFPCGNLGSWPDPMPPYRSDDWPIAGEDVVAASESGEIGDREKNYYDSHDRKNRALEMGLRLAVADSYENLMKRYAYPKGMLQETVKNMQDLMEAFDAEKAEELAPDLRQQALHKIPCRYWRRDRYSPARRAKWGWLIDRVLRLETLPEEMEKTLDKRGIKKKVADLEDALDELQSELRKLPDPEDEDFDTKLDKILLVMQREKARLEAQGVKVGGGELNKNPF